MRARSDPLPETELTSMVDIIFQLMIFFLVTLSVMPSVKSAPQVEGMMNLPTPKRGDSEASVLIQFFKTPTGGLDYYVLQGNDQSAEFYQFFKDKRAVLKAAGAYPAFRNIAANKYQVVYNEQTLEGLLMEIRDYDPAVIIRAPGNLPYGDVVKVTGKMHALGISKIAWVKGTLADLKVEIKKGRARRG
ncbi:hypothetical protein DRQ33_00915 [bacterium]|nr:MAG: hypothetical protein DRQ33_00915 [bacterium]